MGLPFLRLALLITAICCCHFLNLVVCKELNIDTKFERASNERGEYAFSDYRHYHISNQPLFLPNVTTKNGLVRGIVIKASSGRDVNGFLGIPFAKPPIGDLRFMEPRPIDDWNGTYYDAVSLPAACSQLPSTTFPDFPGETIWNPNTQVSEDCLYLNIWVPADIFNNGVHKGIHNTSVMVWIYGGGFITGSSSLDLYDGSKLADENNIIVVSSQYRLGPFGFLYFGNEQVQGNMGLLDQNLALKWTYDNIESFGGDKDSITIFGESSGGASVAYHLLSSLSQPFIKQGIIMSGTTFAPWAFHAPEIALNVSVMLSENVGCGSPALGKSYKEMIDCLRKVDSAILLDRSQAYTSYSFPFVPTIDGRFIKDSPSNLLKNMDSKVISIIIGTTKDEGSYFTQFDFVKNVSSTNQPKITHDELVTHMSQAFGLHQNDSCPAIPVFNIYTNWINPEDTDENLKHLNNALGDYLITCPNREFADAWSLLGNSVYYYHFTQRSSSSPWPDWMGVTHGDDIEYAFDLPLRSVNHTDAEKELARHMTKLFTDFAKTGIPSPKWIPYTKQAPVFLNLNATLISDSTPKNVYGPQAETCAFWNNYGYGSSERMEKLDAVVKYTVAT